MGLSKRRRPFAVLPFGVFIFSAAFGVVACEEEDGAGPEEEERDQAIVDTRISNQSVASYLGGLGDEDEVCDLDVNHYTVGTIDCGTPEDCAEGEVCRAQDGFGGVVNCACVEARQCEDLACAEDEFCLPGTNNASNVCGGAGTSPGCNASCQAGECASDADCAAEEACVFILDECDRRRDTVCVSDAGSGCLGISDACGGVQEACRLNDEGEWACVEPWPAALCD